MSRETERQRIADFFQDLWLNSAYASIPVAWPNHEFDTPADSMFAVYNLVDRGTVRESVGRNYVKRHRGTLQIDLYTPIGSGTIATRLMGDWLENEFDTLDLMTSDSELIQFRTPGSREIAANEQRASNLEDNWGRLVVECPYDRQEIVSK